MKEISLVKALSLMAAGKSPEKADRYLGIYADNMRYLESIQLLGSAPFTITLATDGVTQTAMSTEFLLTFINYASRLYAKLKGATSQAELVAGFKAVDPFVAPYILNNGNTVRSIMESKAKVRLIDIGTAILSFQKNEALLFGFSFAYILLFVLLMTIVYRRVNVERVTVFEVFLDLQDAQIQQFSSKTEKFLCSLHV